jgi:hypothetical protein
MSWKTSPPEGLGQAIRIVLENPSTRALVDEMEKEGPIDIKLDSLKFSGHWNRRERTIYVNKKNLDIVKQVTTIVFELHNMKVSKEFADLNRNARDGKIGKEDYVRSWEQLEHRNVLKGNKCIRRMIDEGCFQKKCEMTLFIPDFQLHFLYQQLIGHSARIVKRYDKFNASGASIPYEGTWEPPLRKWDSSFEKENKDQILKLFQLKAIALYHQGAREGAKKDLEKLVENLTRKSVHDAKAGKILEIARNNFLNFSVDKELQRPLRDKTNKLTAPEGEKGS